MKNTVENVVTTPIVESETGDYANCGEKIADTWREIVHVSSLNLL